MWLVVGLGNPGNKYDQTRHNIGFQVADELARAGGGRFRRSWRVSAYLAEVQEGRERLLVAKPQTYMNLSGQAIAPLLKRKGLAPSDLIVVVDDTELEIGQLRVRPKGSAGGHNGLKSVIASIGTDAFVRVRVGVGRRPPDRDMVEYVLGRFSAVERKAVDDTVLRAADAVRSLVQDGIDRTMNQYNG